MEIGEGWKGIIGTAVGILSLILSSLGISKLLELRQQRQYALADKNADIHLSNQKASIDLDQFAFQKFAERLDKQELEFKELRKELGEVRDKLSSQMERNARLEVENKHLNEEKTRQGEEIRKLRENERILQGQVNSLTNLVTRLQTELEELKKIKEVERKTAER